MVSLPASTFRNKVLGDRHAGAISARTGRRYLLRIGGLHEPVYRSRAVHPLYLGLPVAALSQSPAAQPAEYIYVSTITVKPGGVPAYESFRV